MKWEPLFWGVVITGTWVGSVLHARDSAYRRGYDEAMMVAKDKEKQGQLGLNT